MCNFLFIPCLSSPPPLDKLDIIQTKCPVNTTHLAPDQMTIISATSDIQHWAAWLGPYDNGHVVTWLLRWWSVRNVGRSSHYQPATVMYRVVSGGLQQDWPFPYEVVSFVIYIQGKTFHFWCGVVWSEECINVWWWDLMGVSELHPPGPASLVIVWSEQSLSS